MNAVTTLEPTTTTDYVFTTKSSFPIHNSGSFRFEKTGLLRNSLSIVKTYSLGLSVGVERNHYDNTKYFFRKSWTLSYYKQNKNGQFAKRLDTITLDSKSVADLIGVDNQMSLENLLIDEVVEILQNSINAITNPLSN